MNIGCIPTKALLKSAEMVEYTSHFDDYGLDVDGSIQPNFPKIIARSRGVADKMNKGVKYLMGKNKIDVILGSATLAGGGKIDIKPSVDMDGNKIGKALSVIAKHIIVATGARPQELPFMKIDGKKIISSTEALIQTRRHDRLVICGAGAIGVEFAYFYNSMGTEVTIVEFLPSVVPVEDADVSKQLERSFKKSGIKIMTSAEVTSVDISGKGVKATVKTKKGDQILEADIILSAIGIKSNIENIGLEDVGIAVDRDKIIVNDYYQTNIPGYYAIGDVTSGQALAHVASAEGILCVEKIAGQHVEALDYGNIPGCTYCSPEIASVGLTEAQAKEQGLDIKVGKFPFSASGKASAGGHKEGFVKVIFDAKYGEWLGCHMIGAGVTDMIAEVVLGRKLETTGHEVLKAVHPHPTMSEAVMEAVADAYGEVIHL